MTITPGTVEHGPAGTGHVDLETKHRQWRMVVTLFLVSDVTFVVALFFSYLYLRELNVNHMWLPASVHPPAVYQNVVLAVLVIASAAAWRFGDLGIRKGNQGRLKAGIGLALVLWLVEMAVQAWQFASIDFGPGAGAFASAFYALAGYHMFHLVFGLLIGVAILNRAVRGRYSADDFTQVQVVGYFWYWVAIMATAMALLPK
ncbi:MAG: cytochrome c oxidase subunit 3 [Actinomycetota bacterium]|nr:cytochrome c oxidase subunit 3 [Actinomycetota bacterium]